MYKIFQIGLIAFYVEVTGICFLLVLALSGVYISWTTLSVVLVGWSLFCWLAVYVRGPVGMFFHGRLRRPILEEEAKMGGCMREVMGSAEKLRGMGILPARAGIFRRAGEMKKVRLLIVEVKEEEVFVCNRNVIAISKELLDKLTEDELKGVLAHELGHLNSRDTTLSWAFVTAGDLPELVRRIFRVVGLFVWRVVGLLLVVVLFVLFLFGSRLLLPVLAFGLFFLLFGLLGGVFRWMVLLLSRRGEYRQDAYAFKLGYGAGLRDALKKMAKYGSEQVNTYFILMNGTQPVIYDRIRRLERMLELRV